MQDFIAVVSCKVFPSELEELTTDVVCYLKKKKEPKHIQELEQFQGFVNKLHNL